MNTQTHSRFYSPPATCIVPGCTCRQHLRGLCQGCSKARQRAVTTGKITEEALIAAGLLLPNKLHGKQGKFLRAMERAIPETARQSKFDAAVEETVIVITNPSTPPTSQSNESTAYELPCSL